MRTLASGTLLALTAACSSHPAAPEADRPIPLSDAAFAAHDASHAGDASEAGEGGAGGNTIAVGELSVRVVPKTANVSVLGPGGAPLLAGIDSSNAVGMPQSLDDDAPPLTGFAIRDQASAITMAYGSFRILDDTAPPWQVVATARVSGSTINLLNASGSVLASVAVSQGKDTSSLVLAITAGADAPDGSVPSPPPAPDAGVDAGLPARDAGHDATYGHTDASRDGAVDSAYGGGDAGPPPSPVSIPEAGVLTPVRRRISWGFGCDASDHFAGFGAQTWGVDARGETIPIWIEEEGVGKDLTTDDPTYFWYVVGRRHSAYMPLPEFLSSRGFAVVADTVKRSTFALCSESPNVGRMELELPATINLFYGPDPHDALTRATLHTGRPRIPPAFAFAPWNDAILGSANVRAIAAALRSAGAPSSVIWTEDWRGGSWTGDNYTLEEEWDVDRTLYPDFEAVAQDLHAEGFKWLVYFNSFVETISKAWPETAPKGYLVRRADGRPYTFTDAKQNQASLVDLTHSGGVAWAVGKMQAAITLGADGWMGDFGEWLPTDSYLSGGSGLDLHNTYSLLWTEAQRSALDNAIAADGVQRLSFVRSGWYGTAPLADVFWAGDQRTDFESDDGMPTVLPIGIGVGLAGVSTFGSDIAGYQSATNPTSTKELFFRWTELGAWSPVMRTHHGTEPKLEWNWQSDADTTAEWVRYAKLHVALAPYLRGLAQAAHDTGVSIWRPLSVEFSSDQSAWSVADQVMVGPGVLIAPVQLAGETSRSVYLPKGTWFPWGGGASIQGGSTITAQAPVAEIPVYALAGSIVPTYPDGVQTLTVEPSSVANATSAEDDRIVYAFGGGAGSFVEAPDSGGLSYTLATGAAGTTTWNGTTLAACGATPTAPCATTLASQVTAHVVGPGTLVAGGATLTATGGSATRKLTLVVASP